jgi:hypothetical protein
LVCAEWAANNELDYTRQMYVAEVEVARNGRRECRRFERRSLCMHRTSNAVECEDAVDDSRHGDFAEKNDVKTTEWDDCAQKE